MISYANNLHLREMRCLKVNGSSNVKAFDGSKVLERSFFVCQNRKLSEFDLNKVMKQKFILIAAGLAAVGLLAGCETIPPGVERGPHGTMAYDVLIEASEPGARIEANGQDIAIPLFI